MSLRRKTLIIVILSVIGLILFVSAASNIILGIGFDYLENKGVQSSIDSVRAAVQSENNSLDLATGDLAPRQESYDFLGGANDQYIQDDIGIESFENFR